MRIAQVAPLFESVPPETYGGTERIVSYLTKELVRLGHEVTLFASGDSVTSAELIAGCPRALRLGGCIDHLAPHILMLEQVMQNTVRFDVIHFHIDYLHFPCLRRQKTAHVTTLHGPPRSDLTPLYQEFDDAPLVSISRAQQGMQPTLDWQRTVYHGLPDHLYTFQEAKGGYLVFLGRICPDKGLNRAIEIAIRSGLELRIAAKIDTADRDYFKSVIEPFFTHPLIEYVGEVNEPQKNRLLGGASALLFPIDWTEPFGMVLIEAMACGTPVIA